MQGRFSDDRIENAIGPPVIVCPHRFDEHDLIPRWLAEIAGFENVYVAREVPFMRAPNTGREAGRIDIVLADSSTASDWYGLEASSHKLLSAKPVKREEFETDLRSKLARLDKEPS